MPFCAVDLLVVENECRCENNSLSWGIDGM